MVADNRLVTASSRQVTHIGGWIDQFRRNLTHDLTPASLETIMRQIDDGDMAAMAELAQEMEAKDGHLQGIANTRRQAVTALDWSMRPAENTGDDNFAKTVADYCEATLRKIPRFEETLQHIQRGTGPGISVSEMIWYRSQLVNFQDVPGDRLWEDKPGDIRILTDENSVDGEPVQYGKWIVHTPNAQAGFPLRVTLTRATARYYVIKHYASGDWTAFCEVFGMPVRGASWDPLHPPTDAARTLAESMLKDMGTDQYYLFPENLQLKFHEVARGTQPYEALINWCETKQTILWLGQTLTTEVKDVGSLAAARVHNNVRGTLLAGDIKDEQRTMGCQVLAPMVRLRWPGRRVATPTFFREMLEEQDLEADKLMLEKLKFATQVMNLHFSDAQIRQLLKLPALHGKPHIPPAGQGDSNVL